MSISNRIRRSRPWLLGAALLVSPMLPGCGADQSTGPAENIPKESPVLSSKGSMEAFMKGRNQGKSAAAKPSNASTPSEAPKE